MKKIMKKYFLIILILTISILLSCSGKKSLNGVYRSKEIIPGRTLLTDEDNSSKMDLNFISDSKVQINGPFPITGDYEIKNDTVIIYLTYPIYGQVSTILIIQEDNTLLDVGGKLFCNEGKDVTYEKL